jgi:RecB family exonuclease
LSNRTVFSAGQLERYARCPFAWFLSDLVGLEELEQELDALRVGSLVHDVLAQTYMALRTEGRLPLHEESLARADELLDYHLDKGLRALVVYGSPADRRLARQEAAAGLRRLLRFDTRSGSRLIPRWLERRFGGSEGVDVGGLRLKGRLDRVDASPDGRQLLVIDYKTGSTVFGPSFARDRALQVPLYMMAVRALHPEARVIGGLYAALGAGTRGGMVSEEGAEMLGAWRPGNPVSDDRFQSELDACLGLAQEAAVGMRSAAVPAAPPQGCPRYCDLRALCRGPWRRPPEESPPVMETPLPASGPLPAGAPRQLSLLEEGP